MELEIPKRYKNKSVAQLLPIAQDWFNKMIRLRDKNKPCISCGSWNTSDASHFYSRGNYPGMRFVEDNVHLSCAKCNRFLHGNLLEYRRLLIRKIGIERVEKLEWMSISNRSKKWTRWELIVIILECQSKCKIYELSNN
ncbi:Bacteriophage Lambda NinG protein [Arachidicoccus rhizosphaerae]|uniref:Bacteriophage Lambda NinG protein n=1 Tax=Arachidicoccus rhizosphaerae TaxID=551991 RepID=A0A1H3W4E8_9BACT|nr:Bacteriophage Lambda NinG protein [Arachidicoccus rhizosphaerae]